MPDLFVSYSRDDRAFMLTLSDNLRKLGFNLWYDEKFLTVGTAQWEKAIDEALAQVDAVVVILTPSAATSKWVNIELHRGQLRGKPIFPVLAAGDELTAIPISLSGVQYADMRDGADYDAGFRGLVGGLSAHLGLSLGDYTLDVSGRPRVDLKQPDQREGRRINISQGAAQRSRPLAIAARPVVIFAPLVIIVAVLGGLFFSGILGARNVPTPSPTQAQVAPEATPQPTQPPTESTNSLALAGVTSNSKWTPIMQDIDGVKMALVPKGCFTMGSETGDVDEKPVSQQCFDKPFWIDVTEVTNEQFDRFAGQAGHPSLQPDSNHPREQITWSEASTFCRLRAGRLPTEAEWEYAARGPDNQVYPWGNSFVKDRAVWNVAQTAAAGSLPGGASWVGALDMSGNVWEWVSSWYAPYPYVSTDGREAENNPGAYEYRVLRGGSYSNGDPLQLRAANRAAYAPVVWEGNYGFRCARSY